MTRDLDTFYRLKARIKMGHHLSYSERLEYKALGREWIRVLKQLHDSHGIAAIRRDLRLLYADPARWQKPDLMKEVLG